MLPKIFKISFALLLFCSACAHKPRGVLMETCVIRGEDGNLYCTLKDTSPLVRAPKDADKYIAAPPQDWKALLDDCHSAPYP